MGNLNVQVASRAPGVTSLLFRTDAQGRFSTHTGVAPYLSDTSLIVCPLSPYDYRNGVNALDLAVFGQHLYNVKPFTSPLQYVASDVNDNGALTTIDIINMKKLLGLDYETFPNAQSWRFLDRRYAFTGIANPLGPDKKNCGQTFKPHSDSLHFIGVKLGDVDFSVFSNANAVPATKTVYLDVADQFFQPGDEVRAVFTTSDTIAAQQFTLEHPGLTFVRAEAGISQPQQRPDFFPDTTTERLISVWGSMQKTANRPVFTLVFNARTTSTLISTLSLSNASIETAAFASTARQALPGERMKLALRYTTIGTESAGGNSDRLTTLLPRPNPFSHFLSVEFDTPRSQYMRLHITDAAGRVVAEAGGNFSAGDHRFVFDNTRDWPVGILFCHLQTSREIVRSKILHIKN